MIYPSDIRNKARESLKNKWGIAVGAGFLAALLNGTKVSRVSFINIDYKAIDIETIKYQLEKVFNFESNEIINSVFIISIISAIIFFLALSFLGCIIRVGYSKFNLNLIDDEVLNINVLFKYFRNWKKILCKNLLELLYLSLWSLLLFIPCVIAAYSYAMTDYILAENTDISPNEAITLSKEMMKGNRVRLLWLQLSFIGWEILCALSFGVGYLWLTPYKQASYAHFYRQVLSSYKKQS